MGAETHVFSFDTASCGGCGRSACCCLVRSFAWSLCCQLEATRSVARGCLPSTCGPIHVPNHTSWDTKRNRGGTEDGGILDGERRLSKLRSVSTVHRVAWNTQGSDEPRPLVGGKERRVVEIDPKLTQTNPRHVHTNDDEYDKRTNERTNVRAHSRANARTTKPPERRVHDGSTGASADTATAKGTGIPSVQTDWERPAVGSNPSTSTRRRT